MAIKDVKSQIKLLPKLSLNSEFIIMKSNEFFDTYNFDKRYFDNLRPCLDMYAIAHSDDLVPAVNGGYWRRMIEGISYDNFDADIDFFYSASTAHGYLKTNRVTFCRFLYENFCDPDADTHFAKNINPQKNINIKLTNFFGKSQDVQLMGYYFTHTGTSFIDSIINNIKTMDSFVNMIGYDFYTDSFVFHKDTIDLIRKRHYKVNIFGLKSNRAFSIGLIKRIVKFTGMGYYLEDEDYKKANIHIQECKDADSSYDTETIDFHDIDKNSDNDVVSF